MSVPAGFAFLLLLFCIAQECSTNDAGIVAQLCNDNFCVLRGVSGVNFLLYNFLHRQEQRIAFVAYTAANAQNIRLENIDGIGDTSCQIANVIVYNLLSSLVTGTHIVKGSSTGNPFFVLHCAFWMRCQRFLGHPNQTRCRREDFKAALSAAGAHRPVDINYGMSNFCTTEVGTAATERS
jgi:hypothetical protein